MTSPPDSSKLRGLPGGPIFARSESGEHRVDIELDRAAPARLRKIQHSPLEIHRTRSLADLDLAEETSGGCSALARDVGVNESTVRIAATHPQRNPPWHWLRAMSGRAFVAVWKSMLRDRSRVVRSMARQALDELAAEDDISEPVSA